jgi:hypothetical protein
MCRLWQRGRVLAVVTAAAAGAVIGSSCLCSGQTLTPVLYKASTRAAAAMSIACCLSTWSAAMS